MKGKEDGPKWAMGTGKRVDLVKRADAPGPGVYSPSKAVEGPAFSMGGKMTANEKQFVPGPGQYDPADERVKQSAPGIKIGS